MDSYRKFLFTQLWNHLKLWNQFHFSQRIFKFNPKIYLRKEEYNSVFFQCTAANAYCVQQWFEQRNTFGAQAHENIVYLLVWYIRIRVNVVWETTRNPANRFVMHDKQRQKIALTKRALARFRVLWSTIKCLTNINKLCKNILYVDS